MSDKNKLSDPCPYCNKADCCYILDDVPRMKSMIARMDLELYKLKDTNDGICVDNALLQSKLSSAEKVIEECEKELKLMLTFGKVTEGEGIWLGHSGQLGIEKMLASIKSMKEGGK